ncbi:MAG: hypothetical protein A4E35_00766 [Methanoregula sp. PtaU1.Bin051]|nr:MAG: hypothetical protein A4E35_00766 [Methanoregula sp. PtaU1.Bin051]
MEMEKKEIALIAVLLAAGTVLQYFLSMLHTLLIPDVITAFYCLAVIRFRPAINEAFGIGIAGGFLSMLIPGSILAPANLVSGPAGAYGCYYFYELFRDNTDLSPMIATFVATLVSGFTFVLVATVFVFGTILATFKNFGDFMGVYIPIIVLTAVLNGVIVQVLAMYPRRVADGRSG